MVPRSFIKAYHDGGRPPRVVSDLPGCYPRTKPTGIYGFFACVPCERRFNLWDQYAQHLLEGRDTRRERIAGPYGHTIGYSIPVVDYERLKLFFVSVLWRASVCRDPFYRAFSLGAFEADAARLIVQRTAGPKDEFGLVLEHMVFGKRGRAFISPQRRLVDGVNFVLLYVSAFVAWIKVDHRPMPSSFAEGQLARDEPLIVPLRRFEGSPEWDGCARAVRFAHRRPSVVGTRPSAS